MYLPKFKYWRDRLLALPPLWIAVLVYFGCLVVALWIWRWSYVQETMQARRDFERVSGAAIGRLEARLMAYAQVLRSAAGFYSTANITRKTWLNLAAKLDLNRQYPGIQALSFSPRIAAKDLPRFLAARRAEDTSGYQVYPPGERPYFQVVGYTAPETPSNLHALGYDMASDPARRETMDNARDRNITAMSGKITLIQDAERGREPGFLLFHPLYLGDADPLPDQRREQHAGFIVAAFRMNDFIKATFSPGTESGFALRVFDADLPPGPESLMFDTDPGLARDHRLFHHEGLFSFGGQPWHVVLDSTPQLEMSIDHLRSWQNLAGGVIVAFLSALLAWLLAGSRDKVVQRAREMTADLRASEERFQLVINATEDGIWDRDLVAGTTYVTPRFEEMFGCRPGEFSGMMGSIRGPIHPEDLPSWKTAVQAHLEQRHPFDIEYRARHGSGEWRWYRSRGQAVRNAEGKPLRMVGSLTDITEKKRSEELIWKQANFDTLTGLPNRRMFHDRLAQEIKKAHRAASHQGGSGHQVALLFIDLDHFKEINDTLGHDRGDCLLVEAARRITDCVRATDTVARLGGDEFTVLLAELDDPGSVERVAQSILQKLIEPFHLGDQTVVVSASIGITLYPDDATDLAGLVKGADQAMYVAKSLGRNRYSYFTPALQEAALARLRLINDLRGALAGDQFRVYFQPIVSLSSGRILKAEALIRWQHPQRGLVRPADFIPLAEETGLIIEIGDWVFKESARWAKRWRSMHNAELQVSVNKSPVQFVKDGANHRMWLNHLRQLELPGHSMVIEITEGLLLNTDVAIVETLLNYRDAGIQVAIDDFGTGYSSLAYLKKFDIDYLKIDRSFVRNLATDASDMALSEAIIVMAHKLGLKVIAEGVETAAQRDLLTAAGCDYAQGYLYARPLPPEEFEALLRHGAS